MGSKPHFFRNNWVPAAVWIKNSWVKPCWAWSKHRAVRARLKHLRHFEMQLCQRGDHTNDCSIRKLGYDFRSTHRFTLL